MNPEKKNFNELVDLAMASPGLSAMRPVVEKELLHHEIFQALDADGLLKGLIFQGGTSLRLCRGSDRFSEDIDFAGGTSFSAASMEPIKDCVEQRIGERFGLDVSVHHKPAKAGVDNARNVHVDKWWISIETAPELPMMPRQKIKLEIANVPAHTRELVPLRANYDVLSGMPLVLVNTESLYEIMADKVLAFPTSLFDAKGNPGKLDSGKIRHRDIWDLAWMAGRGVKLAPELVSAKLHDYSVKDYPDLLGAAIERLPEIVASREFKDQMTRFIDASTVARTLAVDGYTNYLATSVGGLFSEMQQALDQPLQESTTARHSSPSPAAPQTQATGLKSKVKQKQKPRR
ncbi:nucleotidyl transferase AbiEii/AbiGii toxin family protein [Duganella phyllosphaerae]|uniref:Nucleotidyl transferase AbiEii toxin, Type IV TA system n=1 Tax=Duganella phyllosphaerae TaxID=762836 RepID=A0A1E7WGE9_9BURK|nr:nucleotidyl transferase AbiEii/AbiGii toxin family protein [Duganella phyllosphaerae]OEZ97420.1 hypothetical protein DUPY_36210 [Duganella phyllosphaerae]